MQIIIETIGIIVASAAAVMINYLLFALIGYWIMIPNIFGLLNKYYLLVLLTTIIIGYVIIIAIDNNPTSVLFIIAYQFKYIILCLFIIETIYFGISALIKLIKIGQLDGRRWLLKGAYLMLGLRIFGGQASLDFKFYTRAVVLLCILTILWLFKGINYLVIPLCFVAGQIFYVMVRTLITPTVLLCTASVEEAANTYKKLSEAASPARVVSLIDAPLSKELLVNFIFDNFRTGFEGWEKILVSLSQLSSIIVVDARFVTSHVMLEAKRAISPMVLHKTYFLIGEDGQCPVLTQLLDKGDLPRSATSRKYLEGDLVKVIRHMTRSYDRLPALWAQLSKNSSGDSIAYVSDEPSLVRFGLEIWQNILRRGFEICYQLPQLSKVQVDISDLQGQVLRNIVSANQPPGWYSISSDGTDSNGNILPIGFYSVSLRADKFHETRQFEITS